jgi:hypothetical protein
MRIVRDCDVKVVFHRVQSSPRLPSKRGLVPLTRNMHKGTSARWPIYAVVQLLQAH